MDLPKELRLRVYELLVVPGLITLRFSPRFAEYDTRYDTITRSSYAESQLFLACKQIQAESLPLYASHNRFLCHGAVDTIYMLRDEPRHSHIYDAPLRDTIRFLSVAFDLRAVNLARAVLNAVHPTSESRGWRERNGGADSGRFHGHLEGQMASLTEALVGQIAMCPRLEFLQISLQNAFGGWGCCRISGRICEDISRVAWEHPPRVVEVVGLLDELDVLIVEERLRRCLPEEKTELRMPVG